VQSIPFPSITICPQTKAKKSLTSFEYSYRQRFEEQIVHGDSLMESIYFETLLHVCDPQLAKYHIMNYSVLNDNYKLVPELEKMLYSVDDTILLCKWRESLVDCSEFYNEVITDQGKCFSFNMMNHQELFQNGT
jgi:acid-sensing ion channel, other